MGKIDPESYLDDEGTRSTRRSRERDKAPRRRARHLEHDDEAALDELIKHGSPEEMAEAPIFIPTYSGSHWEQWWLSHYLGPFAGELITDVLRPVRGGKEASVYCCAAHPATGLELIAAKVYRPRVFRNLRNDSLYRQGRTVRDEQGKAVRDRRAQRALAKRTRFGKDLQHTSWVAHEFHTLERLYQAGADVPRPLGMSDNAILMEYVGALGMPAPALSQLTLPPAAAGPLFQRLLGNVETMLACNCVHGDFSAYNVLYWQGEVRIIDFPQAVDAHLHPGAFALLQRDVDRLCRYFARYGIESDAAELAIALWAHFNGEPVPGAGVAHLAREATGSAHG